MAGWLAGWLAGQLSRRGGFFVALVSKVRLRASLFRPLLVAAMVVVRLRPLPSSSGWSSVLCSGSQVTLLLPFPSLSLYPTSPSSPLRRRLWENATSAQTMSNSPHPLPVGALKPNVWDIDLHAAPAGRPSPTQRWCRLGLVRAAMRVSHRQRTARI